MKRILFICHGNICRSPMAEFVFKKMVNDAGCADNFYIESAATSTEELGKPVYPPVKRLLAEHGMHCDGKYARQVTRADYDKFDLFIIMDERNVRYLKPIIGNDPEGKVHFLMEYADGANADFGEGTGALSALGCKHARGVADPWYTGDYDLAWKDINAGCEGLLKMLTKYQAEEGNCR